MAICNKGEHKLVNILSIRSPAIEEARSVVRWCCTCGAITIDTDLDGRTSSGHAMQMRYPSEGFDSVPSKPNPLIRK